MDLKAVFWTATALFLLLFGVAMGRYFNGNPRVFVLALLVLYVGFASVVFLGAASDWRRWLGLALVALPVLFTAIGMLRA